MNRKIKILHLEDLSSDAELVERELVRGNIRFDKLIVDNRTDYENALTDFNPDIILSDHSLPSFDSIQAIKIVRDRKLNIPFILITATVSEEFAVDIIKSGANDYILKDRMQRLPAAIKVALNHYRVEKEKQLIVEKLIQSEEKYRTIFYKSPLPKWIYDHETLRFIEVNEAAILLYGYSQEEFLSLTIKDITTKQEKSLVVKSVVKVGNDSDLQVRTWRHQKKNREIIIVETTAHFINYNNRKARLVVANNITERILLEKRLAEEKLRKQHEITDAAVTAQEGERAFLGEELHDNINQILATSKLYMDVAISDKNPRTDIIIESRNYIMMGMEEIRKLSKSLTPPSLGEVSLPDALNDLMENINKARKFNFVKDWEGIDKALLDEKISLAIFRIVQEQMNNIIKHSNAETVAISLQYRNGTLELEIKDDGVGFDTTVKRKGIGLKNIQNRAQLYDGSVEISSSPGNGCAMRIIFPKPVIEN